MPRHDAFISYSRKNEPFADRLEKALEAFTPPKGLKAEQRHLAIFRDKQDFTGNEYHQSLERHLKDSTKLIVICTPESARSEYVNDEIRQFAGQRGAAHIVPILLSGVPNNEAGPGQEANRAFPPALCELMAMPLAADYRGFTPGKSKMTGDPYRDSWYTVLANLYDVPRAEIEERDRKRQARARRITALVVTVVLCVIAAAGTIAWKQRGQAQEKDRAARQLQYIGNVALAQQAYDSTDLVGMRSLLQSTAAEFRGFEWSYLWRLSQGPTAAVAPHDPAARAIAFSPDGRQMATGGEGGFVRLWSVEPLKELGRLDGQGHTIKSLAYSTDGKTLAAAREGAPVALWDVEGRRLAGEVPDLGSAVEQVAFSPAGTLLAGIGFEVPGKVLRVWDTAAHRVTAVMKGGMTASASNQLAAFSPDGGTLAMTSGFGFQLCQYPPGTTSDEFDGPGKYVSAMAFSADGKTLAIAGDDGKLLFFDPVARRSSGTLDAHEDYITGVAFSRNGRSLVTGSADKTVKLWDAASHAAKVTWKGHAGSVDAIAISPDARTVASVGDDKTVRLWEVAGRAEYEELTDSDISDSWITELLTSISPSPKDDRVALAAASMIAVWDPATRKLAYRLADHNETISKVAFSPDQRTIAIATKPVELWDLVSGKTAPLPGYTGMAYSVAWSADGKVLAGAGADGTVRLWDAESRQPLPVVMKGHAKAVTSISLAPEGKTLASASDDRTVKLWDVTSGRELASAALTAPAPPNSEDHPITSVQFSPDGKMVAAGAIDGTVTLWRTTGRTLEKLTTLTGHTGAVNDVAFSPDGRTIATASADRTVKLWHAALFRELITLREPKRKRDDLPEFLRGSENIVTAVAFSRDGKSLITGLMDGTVRIRVAAR